MSITGSILLVSFLDQSASAGVTQIRATLTVDASLASSLDELGSILSLLWSGVDLLLGCQLLLVGFRVGAIKASGAPWGA
jgi:hypothetical protein